MSRTRVIELMRLGTAFFPHVIGAGYENRTRLSALAGQCLHQSAKPAYLEVGVGFEPTDDLKPPAVFETAAFSQALPTYHLVGELVSDTIFSLFGRP